MNEKKPVNMPLKILHYAAVLMGVCLASGAGVSLVYVTSRDRIEANQQKAFEARLQAVLGDAEDCRSLNEKEPPESPADAVYVARTDAGVRYVAAGSAQGYQSKVTVLVSVDAADPETPGDGDPAVYRLVVLESQETPGLGENVNAVQSDVSLWSAILGRGGNGEQKRPPFQEQFTGKRLSDLQVTGRDGQITPITGATITSTATTVAAREAIGKIVARTRELYGEPRAADATTEGTWKRP